MFERFFFYLGFENTISLGSYFRDYVVRGVTERKNEKKI